MFFILLRLKETLPVIILTHVELGTETDIRMTQTTAPNGHGAGTFLTRVLSASFRNRRRIQYHLLVATFLCISTSAYAQTLPNPKPWRRTIKIAALVESGYPTALSGGLGFVLGKQRLTGVRGESQLQGVSASIEGGVGGMTARLGWTRLFQYDAGADGFSFEAVYVRPWYLRWGMESGRNYLGPGMTYRLGVTRISGAALVNTERGGWRVYPSVSVGIALPIR